MSDHDTRAIAEWDWIIIGEGDALHAPRDWNDPDGNAYDEDAVTYCGRSGWGRIPGVFERAACKRCAHCCYITGMPEGKGSPKNDDACRPIARRRAEARRP